MLVIPLLRIMVLTVSLHRLQLSPFTFTVEFSALLFLNMHLSGSDTLEWNVFPVIVLFFVPVNEPYMSLFM